MVSISNLEEVESHEVMFDNDPLLHEYANVFPDEILGMPPQCAIDFCIDLILGVEAIS